MSIDSIDSAGARATVISAPASPTDAQPVRHPLQVDDEGEPVELPIEGRLPPGLSGALLRNGPAARHAPAPHPFGDDGLLQRFDLHGGRAYWSRRWVRTAFWCAEHRAGHALPGRFGGPPAEHGIAPEGVANTSVVMHAGHLLALEEFHLPFDIDPDTLATRAPFDFGGALDGPFTAHPRHDPDDGSLIWFGLFADGPLGRDVQLGALDVHGRPLWRAVVTAPYTSFIHDIGVTATQLLLPVLPLTGSLERARAGRPAWVWDPACPARLGVIARPDRTGAARGAAPAASNVAQAAWFDLPACYAFHVMNAWDVPGTDGRVAEMLVMVWPEAPLFPRADGVRTDHAADAVVAGARPTLWRIDHQRPQDGVRVTPLDAPGGEFPRIDERFGGRPMRHGWYAGVRAPDTGARADPDAAAAIDRPPHTRSGFGRVVALDLLHGRVHTWQGPPGTTVGEPVFVPRAPDAAEGDGWLLVMLEQAGRTGLGVFDARRLQAGPVAIAWCPRPQPLGLHGCWLDAGASGIAAPGMAVPGSCPPGPAAPVRG